MKSTVFAAAAALSCTACVAVPEDATPPAAPVAVAPPVVVTPPPVVAPPSPKVERTLPVEPKTAELEALLGEFERLRKLAPSELAREQEIARQAFNQSRSDAARIRYAMTAMLASTPPADEQRALELLEPLVRNPGSVLHGLAYLLSVFVQEQRRTTALVQGLQQNVQGLQQNNQALQQNVHGLQQKLDALRTLERSLSERGEPTPRRR